MKQIIIFLFSLFILILSSGCDIYSPDSLITVTLPDIPPQWERFKEISFSLEYPDISGGKKEVLLPPGVLSYTIRIPKLRNLPVIAQPYGDSFSLCPAGAIYPWHLEKDNSAVLHLTWEQGFSSLILLDCFTKGFDITGFNALRFSNEVLERSGGDPWKLDYSFIAEKIVSGSFRVSYIKMLPEREVSFSPGYGKWFFSSPFSPLYTIQEEESFNFTHIPLGFHRLFHYESPGWYELYVAKQEIIIIYYNCPSHWGGIRKQAKLLDIKNRTTEYTENTE
ncbi:MAG: hypothetical protein JXB88_11540 [Spirochaetales bacterium]|nr:hypothetical protein [Spirochaetales bacterium]